MTGVDVVLLVVAVVAAAIAGVLAVLLLAARRAARAGARSPAHVSARRRRRAPGVEPLPYAEDEDLRPRVAVIVNPTKFPGEAGEAARTTVARMCEAAGWARPIWLETTLADPGAGQTLEAIDEGADVICALGGDGTVRVVGETLAGTGVAMGVLPAGTGNLLARNLALPLDGLESALHVALGGRDRPIDVGRAVLDVSGEDERPQERTFLVMAGLGFDAAIMSDVQDGMKDKMGWLAYFVSGVRNLRGPRTRVRVTYDEGEPQSRRIRTILVGNVGKITGGITLMPDAEIDDGLLDVLTLSPRGVVGWVGVAGQVLSRRRTGHPRVEHQTCLTISVVLDNPQPVQLDGDVVGEFRGLSARVEPGALVVRVPEDSPA